MREGEKEGSYKNSLLLTDGRDCSHDEGEDDCVHHCYFVDSIFFCSTLDSFQCNRHPPLNFCKPDGYKIPRKVSTVAVT